MRKSMLVGCLVLLSLATLNGCYPPSTGNPAHSGANLPWENYGWDVGANPWGGKHGGFSSNSNLARDFEFLSGHRVGLVRVFIFCDLRSGVVIKDGNLSFDGYVYKDMDALIDMADRYGLLLMPVLFDFMIADGLSPVKARVGFGEHPDLLTTGRSKLIALMGQFLAHYGQEPSIYAWDIMNEPEGAIFVGQTELATFVAEMVTAIHQNTGHLATLGSRSLASCQSWKGLGLDLYQFHHYDAMGTNLGGAFPSARWLGFNKPVMVGELEPTMVTKKLDTIIGNGYDGALFWSLNADYSFEAVADEYFEYFEPEPVAPQ